MAKTPKVHDIISLLLTTLSKTSPSLSFIKLLCTNKLYDLSSSTKSSPTKSYLSSPSLVDVDSQAIYDKQAMEGVGEGVDIVEIAPRMRHSTTSSAENLDLVSLIEHFDSMKFLCAHREKFPSICMLARSLIGRFSNNGFQERVLSVTGNAMNDRQCRMAFSHHEKCTILAKKNSYFVMGFSSFFL
mmetsp:Transcript_2775/g.6011  ORF Transcript_2775/g.6011 Transcript_2775/m.6011 type:complete len:186 (-) Transcript_2775:134-691(-)